MRGGEHDTVETTEFALDRCGEIGIVLRSSAFKIERIDRRCARLCGFDLVVYFFQCAHFAPKQHDLRARTRAGERTRAPERAGGTDDQHDAILERVRRCGPVCGQAHRVAQIHHAAFCVSLTMRASSPDSASSSVMSQPPISSPLMNSCGNVGQFE